MNKIFNCKIDDIEEKGIVTVYANAFNNVDSDKDRSHQGSYQKTIQENFKRVKWFLNHAFQTADNYLLGVPLEAVEDQKGLRVTGQLNLKKQISRDILEDYKLYADNDRTLEHSLAIEAMKYEIDKETGIREVYEWKWWEYSTLTSWGANPNTPLVGIKSLKTQEDIIKEITLLKSALKMNYTDERFEQIENTLKTLQSLITEKPLDSTSQGEPVDVCKILQEKSNLFNLKL